MSTASRQVVLGLGNTLNRDEGLGVHALAALRPGLDPHNTVELLDGGTLGLSLLPLVEECSHLLVLDAVNAGQPPGAVVELSRDEIPLYRGIKLSQHQITFQEVLGLASFRGRLPANLHLVGIEPADLRIGYGLSPIVEEAIPVLVSRSLAMLRTWGLQT